MGETVIQNKGRRLTVYARAKRGFTLVEVMVTLMVLAFGLLASVIGIMAALDHGMINEMRNDAIKIAQEQEEAARNMPYADIQKIPVQQTITRQVRKTRVNYTVNFSRPAIAASGASLGMALVQFTVQWTFKNRQYQYVLQTIVRQMK